MTPGSNTGQHDVGSLQHGGYSVVGKKIWMSGAANGIGRATAEALIRGKCGGLAIVDILAEEDGQQICEKLATRHTEVLYYKCDVRDANGLLWCMRAAKDALSGIDIVINNAGIVDEDSLDRCLAVNLQGVVNGTEAAVSLGVPQVVNMGSAAGVFPLPQSVYYAASKHAVVGYSRSIGERLKDRVRICCVCPSFVDTGIGVMSGWTGDTGVMTVNTFVELFMHVLRSAFGGGRVIYVSEKLGAREVRVSVRNKLQMARL